MAFRSFFFFLFFLAIVLTSYSLPFVFIHGLFDDCSTEKSKHIVSYLKDTADVEGQCLEISDWEDKKMAALLIPMLDQIQKACEKVKKIEKLKDGFNIFAVSQGALIARGLIEFCDGAPPVKNYISLAGPQAGVAAIPCDQISNSTIRDVCFWLQPVFDGIVYSEFGQALAAPATYYKLSMKIPEYLKASRFLPKVNNERPEDRNDTYKTRFSSLSNVVLLANENDQFLIPKETAWFGYYKDGTKEIIPLEETELYKQNWIGLKTLNEAGRLQLKTVPGGHADSSDETLNEFVVPYLTNKESVLTLTKPVFL